MRRSDCKRESGAFLLGHEHGERREITDLKFYDELDKDAYETGAITLDSSAYVPLFNYCANKNLRVVADIHVHPGAAFQSSIDRANPMISQLGHIGLILPDYATSKERPRVYAFGSGGWTDETSNGFLYIGWL